MYKLVISKAKLSKTLDNFETLQIESKNFVSRYDSYTLADYILETLNGPVESLKWGLSDYSDKIVLPHSIIVKDIIFEEKDILYSLVIITGCMDTPDIDIDSFIIDIDKCKINNEDMKKLFIFMDGTRENTIDDFYGIVNQSLIAILCRSDNKILKQIIKCYNDGDLLLRQSNKKNILELVNMQKYYKDSYMYT